MKKRDWLAGSAILLIALGVYAVRWWSADAPNQCPDLCQTGTDTYELNESAFLEKMVPRLNTPSMFNLIVFVDPENNCLACLFETEYWLAPMADQPEYKVHFVIPDDVPVERFAGYVDNFAIQKNQLVRIDRKDPLIAFHRYGVLKVFWDREQGVRWFERGTKDEEKQATFPSRIKETISASQ